MVHHPVAVRLWRQRRELVLLAPVWALYVPAEVSVGWALYPPVGVWVWVVLEEVVVAGMGLCVPAAGSGRVAWSRGVQAAPPLASAHRPSPDVVFHYHRQRHRCVHSRRFQMHVMSPPRLDP